MAAAGLALPVVGIDANGPAGLIGHAAIHCRGGETPGGVAVRRDRDEPTLAAERADILQDGVESIQTQIMYADGGFTLQRRNTYAGAQRAITRHVRAALAAANQ